MTQRLILLLLFALTVFLVAGCSDDDDPVDPGPPEDPYVASVIVDPDSWTFDGFGEDTRFTASALDQDGVPIDTVFVWSSSDESVVRVGQDGTALATGLGSAMVIVGAGAAADTAEVNVTLAGAPVVEWIAGGSGDWNEPSNWSAARVPGEGDAAVIGEEGTYTVTLGGDVTVAALVLGGGNGVQILATGVHRLTVATGGLLPGGLLTVDGGFEIRDEFVLAGGDVEGAGLVDVVGGAELDVVGNPIHLRAALENRGTIVSHPGSSLRIVGTLNNTIGGLLEMAGDAFVTVQQGGTFTNSGTIHKSMGEEEASIVVSTTDDNEFTSEGTIHVEEGALGVSGGTLQGRIDIDAGASLVQSGNTALPSINSRGDGAFVVGGRLEVGRNVGQIITIRNLVLDSTRSPSISGSAGVLVDESFVWRRGTIAGPGSFTTQIGSRTTFESRESKILTGTFMRVTGSVEADTDLELSMRDQAAVLVDPNGSWTQTGGGNVEQFTGSETFFEVQGTFTKTGEGNFRVSSEFVCRGQLDLREGTFVANGDFVLRDTGTITGGGKGATGENIRLHLINAPTATLSGALAPGLDDQYALFELQGRPNMTETFTIELDVIIPGDFNAERVTFLSSGVEFGGTLDFNAVNLSQPGVDYRMIGSHVATGTFEILGDNQFDEVVQDASGVVARRF